MGKRRFRYWFLPSRISQSAPAEKLLQQYFTEMQKPGHIGPEAPELNKEFLFHKVQQTILAREARIRLRKRLARIAAALVPLFFAAGVLFYVQKKGQPVTGTPAPLIEKNASPGSLRTLQLSDGTKVWLNAGSSLRFPETFQGGKREVYLRGEGYFEVAPDADKAFIVHTQQVATYVLGTSFNIAAYPAGRRVVVTVLTGKVSVGPDETEHNKTYLTREQQVVYQVDGGFLELNNKVNATESIAWKEGKLMCREIPLREVVEILELRYNVPVAVGNNIGDCTITADFSGQSLDNILAVLAQLVNGEIITQQGGYFLQGEGCFEM